MNKLNIDAEMRARVEAQAATLQGRDRYLFMAGVLTALSLKAPQHWIIKHNLESLKYGGRNNIST
jgi:hypothetical protein